MTNREDTKVTELRALLGDLLTRWEQGPEEAQTPHRRRYELARIKAVITLVAHTHRLGRAVATLIDAGFGLETAPTVRAVVEHGITAQWLLQYGDDASYGFAAEAQRQRVVTGRTLRMLTEVMQLDNVDKMLAGIDADAQHVIGLRKAAKASARNFEALCQDFELGVGYYFGYRMLSTFVHPGPTICEAYLDEHDPPVVRLEPKPVSDVKTWLYQTCCGILWAARTADILDRRHPNRAFLRGVARQLGIPLELQLTSAAIVRRERERQERKRQP